MSVFDYLLKKQTVEGNSKPSNLTLNEFFDCHYYPHIELIKRKPRHDYLTYNKHFRNSIGRLTFTQLDNATLDDWVRGHIRQRYMPGTINKHIFFLNRILNMARNWGVIDHNAFQNRTIKRLNIGDYKQRFLNEAEIKRLLNACNADFHPFLYLFVKLLILTGARKGEARTARWRDINFNEHLWTVPVSKNGRSRRIVLNTAAIMTLDEVRDRADQFFLPHRRDDYVFINPKSKTCYDSFHAAWYRARSVAGLDEVRIHDLRHTYASLLINKGATIYEVQKLLGHHHISMTERYAHLLPNTLQERAEIVSNIVD